MSKIMLVETLDLGLGHVGEVVVFQESSVIRSRRCEEVLTELEPCSKSSCVGSWVGVARRVVIHYYLG
jgi:hypothetical protein